MKQFAVLLIALTLLGCGQTPSFTDRASESSALIADFSSYASVDDVTNLLKNASVTVVEDSQLDPGDQRPPFSILVWAIPFEHMNQPGELHLHFFNDRLMSTSFYPDQMKSYLNALNDSGITLDHEGRCKMKPYTDIWKSTNFNNRGFVCWEDERLQEELNEWIMSYS